MFGRNSAGNQFLFHVFRFVIILTPIITTYEYIFYFPRFIQLYTGINPMKEISVF